MTTAVATRAPVRYATRFEAEGHLYWIQAFDADDVMLWERPAPSVSSILSPITDPLYSRMPPWRREETALRGTYAHKATEIYDDPERELNWETVTPNLEPYLNAWMAFRYASDVDILEIEQRVAHPILWYAGTFDRVAILNGALTVLEIKTTAGSPEPFWGLQIAAYLQAFNLGREKADRAIRRVSVQLRPDETFVLTDWPDQNDLAIFNSLLATHHWREANGYGGG